MKTKEEILDEYGCPSIPFDETITMYYPAIIEAMEFYATIVIEERDKEIEKLRDDIEKCNETLDLVKDSDIIQMYGSIIGRLNLILNQ